MPYKDYTLKARLANRSKMEARLLEMGARFLGLDLQTDTYFKVPPDSYRDGRLKFRQGTLGSLITHYDRSMDKGLERTVVYRYEKNPSKDIVDQLLKNNEQIGVVKKERGMYALDNVRIHLDRLPGGEEFVEIEARDLEGTISDDDLKEKCLRVSRELEIDEKAIVPTGYIENCSSARPVNEGREMSDLDDFATGF